MRTLMVGLLLALGAGCAADPGGPSDAQLTQISPDGLVLTTERTSYAPGQAVLLTLRNETGGALGHNLCASVLERNVAGEWRSVERTAGDPCAMALAILAAGDTATYTHTLPGNLANGVYRFRTELEKIPSGERGWHASNTFEVSS